MMAVVRRRGHTSPEDLISIDPGERRNEGIDYEMNNSTWDTEKVKQSNSVEDTYYSKLQQVTAA